MRISINIELDSETTRPIEMQRLAFLFAGTTALTPVRTVTDSTTHSVDGISVTEAQTVAEYPAPEMRAYAEPAFPQPDVHVAVSPEAVDEAVATPEPVKLGRKPKGVQTPPPATAGEASGPIDLAAALDTALEAMPGVTDLSDVKTDLPTTDAPVAPVEPESTPPTTLAQEVAVAEDSFDLLGDADTKTADEVIAEFHDTVSLPDLPGVETMDHAAAGAEIRRLVIKNTGAWLRDILTHYRVNRISDLSLEQSHDAIRNGRVRAGEVAAAA